MRDREFYAGLALIASPLALGVLVMCGLAIASGWWFPALLAATYGSGLLVALGLAVHWYREDHR